MRTWTRLLPAFALILTCAPSVLQAADPEISLKNDIIELRKAMEKLQTDIGVRGAATGTDLKAIREELGRIRELLEILAQQQGALQRQSGYDPRSVTPGAPPAAIPTTGTITLQNVYPAAATVLINGQSYLVEANRTRIIPNFPVGPFQYSVDVEGYGMVVPARTEVLRSAGYRITIFPRMP